MSMASVDLGGETGRVEGCVVVVVVVSDLRGGCAALGSVDNGGADLM
jgi:hypothetical protein